MSAHDLAAARLEALNMRTERDAAQAEAAALRDALADLRAKVAGEHDASFFGLADGYETGRRQAYRRVLALIGEAAL